MNTYKRGKKDKPSDIDIGSTATSENAGNENETTKGTKHGDNLNADGALFAAPGSATTGNKFSKVKDYVKAIKDVNSMFKKGQKSGDGINKIIKENSGKGEKTDKSEYIYIVKDNKNPSNNVQIRREDYEAQQKKK